MCSYQNSHIEDLFDLDLLISDALDKTFNHFIELMSNTATEALELRRKAVTLIEPPCK